MKKLNISEARAKLPALARMLVREKGSVAYITHRDLDDDLVLTSRKHLEDLERTIADLRKQFVKPFVLRGSVETDLNADELGEMIDEMRREEAAAFERKLDDILGE